MAKTTEKELLDMLRKSSGFRVDGEVKEVIETALEKRVATPVDYVNVYTGEIEQDTSLNNDYISHCPCCYTELDAFDALVNFCPDCGQKLLWK